MRCIPKRILAGCVAIVLAACGGGTDTERLAPREARSGEVAAGAACSASTMTWSDPNSTTATCAGPWEYQKYAPCYALAAAPDCGTPTYPPATCPAQQFGELQTVPQSGTVTGTWTDIQLQSCTTKCTCLDFDKFLGVCNDPGPCTTTCRPTGIRHVPNCDDPAKAQIAAWNAALPPAGAIPPAGHIFNGAYTVVSSAGFAYPTAGTCNINFMRTDYNSATSASVCGLDQSKPIYPQCRTAAHGPAPTQAECGPPQPALFDSSPNLTTDGLKLEAGSQFASGTQKCTTDDPNGFVVTDATGQSKIDPTAAQSKYDRLEGRLGTSISTDPALRDKLVKNLKLLFELAGDLLRTDQQTHATALYASDPSSSYDCGNTWTPPASAATCPTTTTDPINANLRMCSEMLQPHVPAAVTSLVVPQCRSIDPIKALTAVCPKDAYLQSYLDTSSAFLSKEMGDLKTSSGDPGRIAELQGKLANINAWYGGVRSTSSGVVPDATLKGISTVLDGFWRASVINPEATLAVSSTSTVTDSQVSDFGLRAASEVLQAAYPKKPDTVSPPPPAPLGGAPLVFVTDDAIRGLYTRLGDVSAFHDLGCHFKACQQGAASTQISQLWNVLSTLADSTALATAKTGATQVDSGWATAFAGMTDNHAALEKAVNDAQGLASTAAYDPTLLLSQPLSALQTPLVGFSQLIRDSRARTDSYKASGLFIAKPSELKVGLDNAHQAAIHAQLTTVTQQLQTTLANYKAQRSGLVQNVSSDLANKGTQTDLLNQQQQKLQKVADATSDLSGLRLTAADDEARFGNFMQGYQQLVPAMNASGEVVHTSSTPLNISAANAVYSDLTSLSLLDMAVRVGGQTWTLDSTKAIAAGEQINITTTGSWSPTCALSKTPMTNGTLANLTGAIAGPEGFIVTNSSGSFTATGVSNADGHSWTENAGGNQSICAGLSISVGTPGIATFFGAPDISAYVKSEDCLTASVGYQNSSSSTDTNSSGQETRSSFSFAEGIRSRFAPFPNEPVGSLLLVQVPHGSILRTEALDVRVVTPNTSMLVAKDADVYLVVNDLKSADPTPSCTSPSPAALSVTVTRLTPAAAASQQIATGMANALSTLNSEAPNIIAQGRMLATDETKLRNDAYAQVYKQCGTCTSLSSYPESLRNLFDTWLSKEIVHIEREVEMVNIQRAIRQTEMEMRAIDDDLRIAGNQARSISLAQGWLLTDLDGTQLRSEVQELVGMASDWLAPVINFRYPETLSTLSLTELQQIDALTNISPSAGIVDLANSAQQALQTIQTRLSAEQTAGPGVSVIDVAVSFPRTDKAIPNSLWKKVDPERSQAVWSDILAGRNPVISLRPSDIYDFDGGTARLGCAFSAPVINTMGYYIAWSSPNVIPTYNLPTVIGNTMSFPLASPADILSVNFTNTTYLAPQPGMLFGATGNAVTSLGTFWQQPGRQYATGLSPFSDFGVDVQSLNRDFPLAASNPLQSGNELIVVLRLETRSDGPGIPLPGVPGCF